MPMVSSYREMEETKIKKEMEHQDMTSNVSASK